MADDLKIFDPRGIRCRQRRGRSWFRFVDGRINVADAIAPNGAKELVVSIIDVDVGGVGRGQAVPVVMAMASEAQTKNLSRKP